MDNFEADEETNASEPGADTKVGAGKMKITKARVMAVTIVPKPVGGPEQDDFLNAVAIGNCELTAEELLTKLLAIEEQMGRVRDIKWGPRIIDLDLIVYGDQVIDSDFLKLPHPLAQSREFVLSPWLSIDPDGEIPGVGSIKTLLASINSSR